MSAVLTRPNPRSSARSTSKQASLHGETDAVLRDLAFVLHLTQRVKAELHTEQQDSAEVRSSRFVSI